ncbi:MAG: polysaccharide deacetylase family protein [Chitinivibrionales bacterium]|nr:polysaccharide deacetylase family protein [Chitinivibrionales bacterium]MBD3396829.1 polysaccharide deacetylase family protein [Chitinivibrionales bacterium]
MSLRPFHLWLVSLCTFAVAMVLAPDQRIALAVGMIAHVPVFLWGVFDIRAQFFCHALFRAPAEEHMVAVTFDDGPDPELTPAILDLLKRHAATATFFVVGAAAEKHPDLVKRMVAEGHTVACHDLTHSVLANFRLTRQMIREIGAARDSIAGITGKAPALYRPPVGLANPHLGKALDTLGMTCIGWSRSARDAGNRREGRLKELRALADPGEVIMLHDCLPRRELKEKVLDNVNRLLEAIERRGLRAVSVNELFAVPAYGNARGA